MALRPIYKQRHLKQTPGEPQVDAEEMPEETQSKVIYVVFGVLIIFGVVTGFMLSRRSSTVSVGGMMVTTTADGKKAVGSSDTTTFKDSAEGTVEKGGLNGEGTHKLIRDGGPSQTVYLISSVVDLDEFDGKKVKVWGQTMAAKKAAWLMDVGKVETE